MKRRSAVDNGSVIKTPADPTSRPLYRHEESSFADDDGDEFFNFKRSKKDKPTNVDKKDQPTNEERIKDVENEQEGDNRDNSEEKAEYVASQADPGPSNLATRQTSSAEDAPVCKRSDTWKRASVLDHFKSAVEDGMDIDSLLHLLRSYVRSLGHRKGYKLACKDVKMLIRDIENNDGEDDIVELAENYHIALSKLPAILE